MFTGIIRHVGVVASSRPSPSGRRLGVELGPLAEGLGLGDSVAVNGVCLTVAKLTRSTGEFDVVSETLEHTTLASLKVGSKVNIERSLRLADLLEGHLVQGHVDGVAEVRSIDKAAGSAGRGWLVEFAAPAELTDLMVPKGSVAVDGVSLTLVAAANGRFTVALIPTTLGETTLAELSVGSRANVEADIIGKYVRRYVRQMASAPTGGVTAQKLKGAGFA